MLSFWLCIYSYKNYVDLVGFEITNHDEGNDFYPFYLMNIWTGSDITSGPLWMEYISFLNSVRVCFWPLIHLIAHETWTIWNIGTGILYFGWNHWNFFNYKCYHLIVVSCLIKFISFCHLQFMSLSLLYLSSSSYFLLANGLVIKWDLLLKFFSFAIAS